MCVCVCVLSAFSKEQKHLEKRYLFRLQLFKKQLLELKKIIGICFVSMKKINKPQKPQKNTNKVRIWKRLRKCYRKQMNDSDLPV